MKKQIGNILAGAGFFGILYFGYQYLQDSDSFEVLGADIAISTGDYVPILISIIVMLAGILIARSN